MKKIAILYPAHFEQSFGGAEIQVKYLYEACLENGFEVHFIFEDKGTKITQRENVFLYPIRKKIVYKGFGKGWFLCKRQIEIFLDQASPDVIYTRLGSSWVGIAAKYAKKHNIKHIHALASDKDTQRKLLGKPYYPLFSQIETFWLNYGLKNASVIISQNELQSHNLEKRWRKNSVIINQMTPLVAEETIKKRTNKVQILWVANFKDAKRPELFIELAESLAPYKDKVEMYMCGRIPDNYRHLLKEVESIPWLKCLGPLSQEDVFKLMAESHILVNTSEYEGFSNTFVQAWMRKMVVVSMNSNPSNIITDNGIGFITPNMSSLKQTVEQLLNDTSVIDAIGEKAYKYAVSNHGLDNNISKIIEQI